MILPKAYFISKVVLIQFNDFTFWAPKNIRVSANTVLSYPDSVIEPPAVCHNFPADEILPYLLEIICDNLVYGSIVYVDQNPHESGNRNILALNEISIFATVTVETISEVRGYQLVTAKPLKTPWT